MLQDNFFLKKWAIKNKRLKLTTFPTDIHSAFALEFDEHGL